MVFLLERAKLVVEGAGAVGVAALLGGHVRAAPGGATGGVLSGGNGDAGRVAPGRPPRAGGAGGDDGRRALRRQRRRGAARRRRPARRDRRERRARSSSVQASTSTWRAASSSRRRRRARSLAFASSMTSKSSPRAVSQ